MSNEDELYQIARRVLLDALDALGAHRDALVLVGAQAIYLRVGEADIAVAPHTSDGDLGIDPARLDRDPALDALMRKAHFFPQTNSSVGIWVRAQKRQDGEEVLVAVDLLVPESMSPGAGSRAARLEGHDKRAARKVAGLEGIVVDADTLEIAALQHGDDRRFSIRVAGHAALLVAKLKKISERDGTARLQDKDALDVWRLLRGTATEALAQRYDSLLADPRTKTTAEEGLALLKRLFGASSSVGIAMTIRAVGPLGNESEIAASLQALVEDLLAALGRS